MGKDQLTEREHRTPRCDESRRTGLSKAQRTVLPLLGERAGVRAVPKLDSGIAANTLAVGNEAECV